MLFALIGIPLPVVPTVPFLILSAWAAGKGWPEFETWLLRHPKYGPPIKLWRESGTISRNAKYFASTMMSVSFLILWLFGPRIELRVAVSFFLIAVGVWLWRRPEPKKAFETK